MPTGLEAGRSAPVRTHPPHRPARERAARGPHRTHRPGYSPAWRPARVWHAALGPQSARRRAGGTPPRRRGRHAPALGRPSSRAPRQPPRQDPPRPTPGATHGDPDRRPGQLPPPTLDAPLVVALVKLIGTRPTAPGD